MPDIKEILGKRIKKLREEIGLSQEELALRIKLHPSFISMIEKGKRLPSLYTIEEIATALNMTLSELFNFTTQKSKLDPVTKEISKLIKNQPERNKKIVLNIIRTLTSKKI